MLYVNAFSNNVSSGVKQAGNAIASLASSAQTKSTAAAKATLATVSEKARAGASFVNNHKLAVSATVLTTIVAAGSAYYFQQDIAQYCGLGQEPKTISAPKAPAPKAPAQPKTNDDSSSVAAPAEKGLIKTTVDTVSVAAPAEKGLIKTTVDTVKASSLSSKMCAVSTAATAFVAFTNAVPNPVSPALTLMGTVISAPVCLIAAS